jgi:ATP-dependent DNA helicase UvrD/PcrA
MSKTSITQIQELEQENYCVRLLIRNILEFPDKFPQESCQSVKLETNYRSNPDIIKFYNQWMDTLNWTQEGRSFRFNKKISERDDKNFADVPAVIEVSGSEHSQNWHNEVLAFLGKLKSSSAITDWNQVAFLFRSVKNQRVIELAGTLEENGIPVYSPRSNMFFQREEVRLMLGALIFLFPQFPEIRKWRDNANLEIWDYYDRDCFVAFAQELRKPENRSLLAWCRDTGKSHLNLYKSTPYAFSWLFYQLLQFPLFSRYLGDTSLGGVIDSRPARNLGIFSRLLTKFEYLHNVSVLNPKYLERDIRQLFNNFIRFLKEGGIDEYEDVSEYAPSGCISFLTIHQSKGLEFPVVVVGSLGAVPREQHTEIDEILQSGYLRKPPFEPLERTKFYDFWRVFYTAFYRAQNLLVLSCQERQGRYRTPSKYFAKLYDQVISWRDEAFAPEQLQVEMIKDVSLKNEYSFTSHIAVFENCARQYQFFKELGFAPVRRGAIAFGTLVHETIEDMHKAVLRGETWKVTPDQVEFWLNANYANLIKKEKIHLAPRTLASALSHVMNYLERENESWDRLRDAEVDVSLVKNKYILKGSVDLIRGEGDTVELLDFKSERKPDIFAERDRLDRYRRQLEVYAHIVEERTGLDVSKMHLYYTGESSGTPYVSFPKKTSSIEGTIGAFDTIVGRIESEDFSVEERPAKFCPECDMQAYCDAR